MRIALLPTQSDQSGACRIRTGDFAYEFSYVVACDFSGFA